MGRKEVLDQFGAVNGKLPSLAPDGWPICYIMDDGAVLCAGCANNSDSAELPTLAAQQQAIVAPDYLGANTFTRCDNCRVHIEGFYGPTDEVE